MAYSRWGRSDIYAYNSIEGGVWIGVANNRWDRIADDLVEIDLPYAGQVFNCICPKKAITILGELRDLGYRFDYNKVVSRIRRDLGSDEPYRLFPRKDLPIRQEIDWDDPNVEKGNASITAHLTPTLKLALTEEARFLNTTVSKLVTGLIYQFMDERKSENMTLAERREAEEAHNKWLSGIGGAMALGSFPDETMMAAKKSDLEKILPATPPDEVGADD